MQTPFSDFKATEMSNERIDGFFVRPCNMDLLYTPNATFVEGQRGTGKTMIMRYMANHPRLKDGKVEYLCVYLRFNPFVNGIELLSNNNDLFYHQLAITLVNLVIERLIFILKEQNWSFSKITQLAEVVFSSFYYDRTEILRLEEIKDFLNKRRIELMSYLRNPKNVKAPLICEFSDIYNRIVSILHEDEHFSETTILFLLDEYETLKRAQKTAINAVIKAAEYGYTFKVFHRPFGLDSQNVLDTHEYLKERDDYTVLDYYDDIIGNDTEYETFVKAVLHKRLEIYYQNNKIDVLEDDLNIYSYLEEISLSDEIIQIVQGKKDYFGNLKKSIQKDISPSEWKKVRDYVEGSEDLLDIKLLHSIILKYKNGKTKESLSPCEIVNEFRNKTEKYNNWYHNYRTAILYYTCFEVSGHRKLAGLSNIINISGGVVRNVLNTMHYVFMNASVDEKGKFRKATVDQQYNALRHVSEIARDDIINIPEYGKDVLRLIEYLCYICQLYHRDPLLKKWEPNHFLITEKIGEISKDEETEIEKVLSEACTWGQLVVLPQNKKKNKDEFALNGCLYGIHPIISIYYDISWRRKQRCEIGAAELYKAVFGDGGEINNLKMKRRKEILNETTEENNYGHQIKIEEL